MSKDTFFLPLGVEPLRPSAMIMFELCIRRPVLTIVLSLIVVLVGLICSQRLPVREYPKMDTPVVSITTAYGGASAAIMETEVTTVIEDALAGIEGTRKITSMSSEQTSQISVEFELSRVSIGLEFPASIGAQYPATLQVAEPVAQGGRGRVRSGS